MPVNIAIMPFAKELDFEKALATQLTQHGWEPAVILNPTEEQLIKNWAAILYNNNRDKNRLGDFPLTATEMQQVIDQVNRCKNPYETNKLINGGLVQIKRDNKEDLINYGKEVYLKIFDAKEIRTGQSVYQIVRQPKFETKHPLASTRRGDVMLLINGMPVIHIELKRSGVDVTQAVNQIKRYTHEGVFSTGIFSLIQVFVAMTPEKTLYFANPGVEERFEPSFYFHWADYNNDEMFDWKRITATLLSIPMAHQLIGFYTIADDKDETLKVLRSYQYFATYKICDRVHETNWDDHQHHGGFIWHTTGSGKTMTSFKAAQLIANSADADKVVFLLDRIELSTQSLDEYRGFAGEKDNVQDAENTADLIGKLESDEKDDCLIVTSIQKMSRITSDNHVPESTLKHIGKKRLVFIVDECHRGVYGSMLMNIKNTFPRGILFGFTGTPVFDANAHGELTTEVIFGDMLHKYTLANGIPDGNVLGFDLYRVDTFDEQEVRETVALKMADADNVEEIVNDIAKKAIYDQYMDPQQVDVYKIEAEAKSLYRSDKHHLAVAQYIVNERPVLSKNGKFHAILATKTIPEAIAYYTLFKKNYPEYNIAAIFDDTIDNVEGAGYKEDAILEMLDDYNKKFKTDFKQSTYGKYKKDVAKRLAHKKPYLNIEKTKDKQLDLLIVVTQMLTGYDSKWVNTLYVDKLLYYVDVIQAFSRTNRLFGPEKPFGIIKYFDRPNQMSKNINDALELYVDQPTSVFVDRLEKNLEDINNGFRIIKTLFDAESIENFNRLPQAKASRNKFASEFCNITKHLEAAKMQGFVWEKVNYEFKHTYGYVKLAMEINEQTYNILLQRYRELFEHKPGGSEDDDVYKLETYITEQGTGTIDADYINSKFIRFVKNLYTSGPGSDLVKTALKELSMSFASLSQRDQRTATLILHDIQSGDLRLTPKKTIYDYIIDYQNSECEQQIFTLCEAIGLNKDVLKDIMAKDVNEQNLNEFGQFDNLLSGVDRTKAVEFLKRVLGKEVKRMFLMTNISNILRRFILDPLDRSKIIFSYQNEGYVLDYNVPDELPELPKKDEDSHDEKPQQTDTNKLDDKAKRENIRNLVMANLRGISGMPPSEEVVNGFFKIVNIPTGLSRLDGVALDMYDDFDELFARKNVNFVKKHTCSGNLLVKFEVFLKKVYFLLNGKEVPPKPGEDKVNLGNAIYQFDCLRKLRYRPEEKYIRLNGYLELIRNQRNTEEGNGAHYSMYSSEEELDETVKAAVTMYMYVTGMCLKDLKYKYSI
jgi:type I restriction enzyme R subunit